MADIAGEILKGNLSVVAPGHEAEGGPTGLDRSSQDKVAARDDRGEGRGMEFEIGGAPNRSKDDIAKMIQGIDAGLEGEAPQRRQVAERDTGWER